MNANTVFWKWMIPLSLLAAVVLRCGWIGNMEWKSDEKWVYSHALAMGRTQPIPLLGQESSVPGLHNPGFSAWIWAALARVSGADHPFELARATQIANLLALVGLFLIGARVVPSGQNREAWLWTGALASVNYAAVLFQRKIWNLTIVAPFSVCFLLGWLRRERFGYAFLWALMALLVAQIHMGGFFLVAGFSAWALLFDRKRVNWKGWFAGSVVGTVPLIPWLFHYWSLRDRLGHGPFHEMLLFRFQRNWFDDALGIGEDYSLGLWGQYQEFLKDPWIGGHPTYLVDVIRLSLTAIGAAILLFAIYRFVRNFPGWRALVNGTARTETGFTIAAGFLGMGTLFWLSRMTVHRHYMTSTFPLEFLSLAWLAVRCAPRPRLVLGTIWVLQAVLTLLFFLHIDANCGALKGDYGPAWRCQKDPMSGVETP